MYALGGDDGLLAGLVAVGVAEGDDGEGGAAAGVVDDVLDDALDVAVALGVVDGAEAGGPLPVLVVRLEDLPGALALGSDPLTHDLPLWICKFTIFVEYLEIRKFTG